MSAELKPQPDPAEVLCKALFNASAQLSLNQQELGGVLGIDRTGVSRLKQSGSLDPASKRGELALLLVRVARALYALSGGNPEWARHFMRSSNKLTGGIPVEQVQSIQGLTRVLTYLDGIRGKI